MQFVYLWVVLQGNNNNNIFKRFYRQTNRVHQFLRQMFQVSVIHQYLAKT